MERLGRYEILGTLDVGGMAEVLLARPADPSEGDGLVVIKRILPELARKPEFVQSFLREARILARIRHPNVVAIHDLGHDDDGLYLVMDYVDGRSLSALTRALKGAQSRVGPAIAAHLFAEACAGLHAAHELTDESGKPLHIIHRDISPQNLMVSRSGDVRLLDFGIAWDAEYASNTATGHVKGKAEYMSPEQCRGDRIDRRTDLFSLGIVLYELTTQTRLFKRASAPLTMRAVCNDPVPYPSERTADYPPSLEQVVMRALARDPGERFQTAAQMRAALLEVKELLGSGDLRTETARLVASLPPAEARVDARHLARAHVPTVAMRRPTLSSQPPDDVSHVTTPSGPGAAEDTLTSERELRSAPPQWQPPHETAPLLPRAASRASPEADRSRPTPPRARGTGPSPSERSGTVFSENPDLEAPATAHPSATDLVHFSRELTEARTGHRARRLVAVGVALGAAAGVFALTWFAPQRRHTGGAVPRAQTDAGSASASAPGPVDASTPALANLLPEASDAGRESMEADASTLADESPPVQADAGTDEVLTDGGSARSAETARDAGATDAGDAGISDAGTADAGAGQPGPLAERTALLRVESVPPGVQVLVDGAAKGVTPLELRVPAGKRPLELGARRSGWAQTTHTLVPDGDQRVILTYPSKPKRPPPKRRGAPASDAPRVQVERLPVKGR